MGTVRRVIFEEHSTRNMSLQRREVNSPPTFFDGMRDGMDHLRVYIPGTIFVFALVIIIGIVILVHAAL